MNFFASSGFCVYPADARNLSAKELEDYQIFLAPMAMQAYPGYSHLLAQSNWQPIEERSLDERFADFKVRLAAAIAKRG